MISYLSWKLIELSNSKCSILTTSWVWYEVLLSENTSLKLTFWDSVELFIYHNINENSQSLFWFFSKEEKDLFLELTKVSWVWWKSALNILDLGFTQIFNAIVWEDINFLSQAKWIWKKMAEKIIVELKDKDFIKLNYLSWWLKSKEDNKYITIDWGLHREIKLSLVSMGYNQYKVEEILKELPADLINIWDIIPYVIRKIN